MKRRELLFGIPCAALAAAFPLRYAVCSETFAGMPFERACIAAAKIGYTGIEVQPSHLSADPASLTPAQRKTFRGQIHDAGLSFVGTHSLLGAPAGLHLTTPNRSVRDKSWEYFRRLIDLTADLGAPSVMVLGSGKQRDAVDGMTPGEATKILREGLAGIAPAAFARRVTILLEPLSPKFARVVNTLAEAVAIVKEIGSPAVQTMFDTHNTVAESDPHDVVMGRHMANIRHVHVNEMDGRYPGSGDYPFLPLLRKLVEIRYPEWVSVEVFDFQPDGETVARKSLEFLRTLESRL